MEEKNFDSQGDAYLSDTLRYTNVFTFMSYNMPMTSVKEKMKHDFLHQEK